MTSLSFRAAETARNPSPSLSFRAAETARNPLPTKHLLALATLCALIALIGILADPTHTWPAILLAGYFAAGVGLGAGFFMAVHDVSGATWMQRLRPVAQAFTPLAPFGAALLLLCVLFGASTLYPPVHGAGFKALWLTRSFVIARAVAYLLLWTAAVRYLRGALYIVVFAVTVWLSSVDFVMALDPAWSSTMFGVYHFAGLFAAAIAAIAIAAVRGGATDDEKHDLGKLLFAFSTFWMYIWFSQYMLIWYSNLSEESGYYVVRTRGGWGVVMIATVTLNWIVPFVVLMSQRAKKNATILTRVAYAVLAGHAIDLFIAIYPTRSATPTLTGWDAAIVLGTLAAALLLVRRALARRPTPAEPMVTLTLPPSRPSERQPVW